MYLSFQHQKNCLLSPIVPSVVGGSLFTAFDVVTQRGGGHWRAIPGRLGTYAGAIYVYNILQCPMEAIEGRPSAWHNAASGALLGYVGVSRNLLGVPLVDDYFFYRNPRISPSLAGAAVYGAMGCFMATLGGKPF